MSYAQEGVMTSASITANVAVTNFTPTFSGGGAELVVVPAIIDTSNSCTGATIGNHANITQGTSFIAAAANGYICVIAWATYNGAAGNPTLQLNYTGGNSGATGGKIQTLVFTGYSPGIIQAPGQSANANGASSPAAVTLSSTPPVLAGDLVIAIVNNTGAHNFTAGSGYTNQGNTSAWSGNVTCVLTTTGLSEPGGVPVVQATFSPNANWNMLAADFPGATQPLPPFTQTQFFDQSTTLFTT